MTNSALMQYKSQAISTMSSGELIVTLFEGILKNLRVAAQLYEKGDVAVAATCTQKCKAIFDHLILSLDFNYELSNNLFMLYNFFKQEIITAEVKRSADPINEILPLISDLKNTWVEAKKLSHSMK